MATPEELAAASLRGVRSGGPVPGAPVSPSLPKTTNTVGGLSNYGAPSAQAQSAAAQAAAEGGFNPNRAAPPPEYAPNWTPGNDRAPMASGMRDVQPYGGGPTRGQGFTFADAGHAPGPQAGTRAGPWTAGVEEPFGQPAKAAPDKWNGGLRGGLRDAGRGADAVTDVLSGAEKFGYRAAQGVRALAPLARAAGGADVVSNFNDYKIDDPSVDSSAGGSLRAITSGHFGDGAFRRSLGKGLIETGMDLGSNVANTLDLVVPGNAPVSTAYNAMLRDTFGSQLIDNSGDGHQGVKLVPRADAPQGLAPQGSPEPAPNFSDDDAAMNARLAKTPGAAGGITQLTGANGVRDFSNLRGGQAPVAQSAAVTAQLQGERGLRDQTEQQLQGRYARTEADRQSVLRQQAAQAEQRAMVQQLMQKPDTRALDEQIAASGSLNERKILAEQKETLLRDHGVRAGAALQASTAAAQTTAQSEIARAQNDTTLASNQLTAATSRQQGMREQDNKNRDFNLREEEIANRREDSNIKNRESAETALQKRLEANSPGSDGKPDGNAVAQKRGYLDRGLADSGKQGWHELGPQAQDQMLAASDLLHRVRADGGFAPWKPAILKTVSPLDLMDMQYDEGKGAYIVTRAGSRAMGQQIPARYFKREDADHFLGTPTNKYDSLIKGLRDDAR